MKRQFQFACILLMTVGLTTMAHAQLASYVDDHGNMIFINDDPPRAASAKASRKASDSAAASRQGPSKQEAVLPAASAPASAAPAVLDRAVEESAEKHHVDPALVRAVISTESNWNASAVSSKGAQGLMQLIPETAQSLGVGNAFDPEENIDAGVRYLSMLLARYNGDVNKALAAYNAGPGAVDRFGGVPNYRETRNYVRKVTSTYFRPGSERQSRAYDEPAHIYRTVDDSGRIIFVNE